MRAAPAADRSIEFNVTPMIDVVFLLIVFFLVSSHLAQQKPQLDVDLPAAASGAPASETARHLTVSVLPNGEVFVNGEAISQESLAKRIEQAATQREGDLEVRVRADRTADFGVLQPILLACSEAGVWNIALAVNEGTP
ncbi:MAG: biopolymer transporter ExbD [Planctomycetota bacterium]